MCTIIRVNWTERKTSTRVVLMVSTWVRVFHSCLAFAFQEIKWTTCRMKTWLRHKLRLTRSHSLSHMIHACFMYMYMLELTKSCERSLNTYYELWTRLTFVWPLHWPKTKKKRRKHHSHVEVQVCLFTLSVAKLNGFEWIVTNRVPFLLLLWLFFDGLCHFFNVCWLVNTIADGRTICHDTQLLTTRVQVCKFIENLYKHLT